MSRRRFALLLKTYSTDFEYAARLVASFHRFNADGLHLFCVVPQLDLDKFKPLQAPTVTVLEESALEQYFTQEAVSGIRPGYINQEIVKLAFWELGLAANYLPVDSDAVFLRPFGVADFMHSADVPYTVLLEDRELQVDSDYFATHWQGREKVLRHIQSEVGLNDARLLTCHGHQVLSSVVLRSLKQDFLERRGWSYARMLAEGPYEFSWYNFWLQKSKVIPIEVREPYFKVIHSAKQHTDMLLEGVSLEDVARGYLGIIVNSNFAKVWNDVHHETSRADALSGYLSWSMLVSIAGAKVRRVFCRRPV